MSRSSELWTTVNIQTTDSIAGDPKDSLVKSHIGFDELVMLKTPVSHRGEGSTKFGDVVGSRAQPRERPAQARQSVEPPSIMERNAIESRIRNSRGSRESRQLRC
jgi:hypothetical protein